MKTCSRCKTKVSNLYTYSRTTKLNSRTINLCDDCIGACLTILLSESLGHKDNFETLWSYLNETQRR